MRNNDEGAEKGGEYFRDVSPVSCLLSPGRSEAGDGMLPSLLASPSPDHLSVLTCERASQQLTGKLNFYKYGHFLPSSFLR